MAAGIDYTPKIYIRDFVITDFRALWPTFTYLWTPSDIALRRDLFMRTTPSGELLVSGDEQTNGDGIELSGDMQIVPDCTLSLSRSSSYHLVGFDTALTTSFVAPIDLGVFVLTGNSVELLTALFLRTNVTPYTLTGNAAILRTDLIETPELGEFVLTGNAAALKTSFIMAAEATTYAWTGFATGDFKLQHAIQPITSTYTLTGNAAVFTTDLFLRVDVTTYTLAGIATAFKRQLRFAADPNQTYTWIGNAAGLLVQERLPSDLGTYVLTGFATALAHQFRLDATPQQTYDLVATVTILTFNAGAPANELRTSGDMQSGGDGIELTGDMQTVPDDVLDLSSAQLPAVVGTFAMTGNAAILSFNGSVELSGDMQDVTDDALELSGDEQSGTDELKTSGSD